MPEKETLKKARQDAREGKSPSTRAGEFVHEEIEHVREGKHGARSTKQAIAIGLSKARRAGVKIPPKPGASDKGESAAKHKTSRARSRASTNALQREGHTAAAHTALSKQARSAAQHRSASSRHDAAKKAARTRARKG